MRIIKKVLIFVFGVLIVMLVGLKLYSLTSYEPLDEMYEAIDAMESVISVYEDSNEISYRVDNPIKNLVFIPGGFVEPESYMYLALSLAEAGYDVTIVKGFFNLAIFSPNRGRQFLSEETDNVVLGHSLGGVTSSLLASANELVNEVIFLASYPIKDVNDKDVYYILAEYDFDMTDPRVVDSMVYSQNEVFYVIEGGNHAQFGWYGPQKGDLDADIDTLTQQNLIVEKILEFIG